MSKIITYKGTPIVLHNPYCPLCETEMQPVTELDDKLDCPLCRAKEEVKQLREAAYGAISSLNTQRKYITDDIQAMGHSQDAIGKLQAALKEKP